MHGHIRAHFGQPEEVLLKAPKWYGNESKGEEDKGKGKDEDMGNAACPPTEQDKAP